MTPQYANTNKRDANEKSILEFWRKFDTFWIQALPGQGCDGFLFHAGTVYVVEIKNPATRWKLTKEEDRTKTMVESIGIGYRIIQTTKDAARLIGIDIEE